MLRSILSAVALAGLIAVAHPAFAGPSHDGVRSRPTRCSRHATARIAATCLFAAVTGRAGAGWFRLGLNHSQSDVSLQRDHVLAAPNHSLRVLVQIKSKSTQAFQAFDRAHFTPPPAPHSRRRAYFCL